MFKAKNGFKRGAVVAVFFALLFFSYVLPVGAQTNIDPVCWQKEDCVEARKKFGFGDQEAADGFLKDLDPCVGGGWGKCLPAGKTTASIALGGKKEFADIGDYIQTVYKYVLSVVGILAAVLIVVSGIQWTSSAGNSEAIGAAKKRIGGALIGLVIAYSSYIILNTINPALVNLRLPQAFMLRTVSPEGEGDFCRTEGPLYTECTSKGQPGEYACYPFFRNGPLERYGRFGFEVLVTVATFYIPMPGISGGKAASFLGEKLGTNVTSKIGGWVIDKVVWVGEKAGGKKYFNFFLKGPKEQILSLWKATSPAVAGEATGQLSFNFAKQEIAKDTTGMALKRFGNAVVKSFAPTAKIIVGATGAAKGLTYTTEKVVDTVTSQAAVFEGAGSGSTDTERQETITEVFTSAIPENNFLPDDVYAILLNEGKEKGLPGVCRPSRQNQPGSPCNALVPNDCAVGYKCVDIHILTGWVEGVKFGICSSGELSSVCNTSADCKNGAVCVNDEMNSKVCSDGSFGTVCTNNPSICTNGLVCRPPLDGGPRSYCFSESKGKVRDKCKLTVEELGATEGVSGTCKEWLVCSTPPGIQDGICTDGFKDSPCYRNKHCKGGYCAGAQSDTAGTCIYE